MLAILKAIREHLSEIPAAHAFESCAPETGTYADGALPLQSFDPKMDRSRDSARAAFLRDYGQGRIVRPEGAGYA